MDLNNIPWGIIGTLAGALIGGGITVITTRVPLKNQRELEAERLRARRQNTLHKDFSQRFQSLATDLANAAHCMCWFTWHATQDTMTEEAIKSYHDEIHEILPKIIGDHISVTAVDKELGTLSRKLVDEAHDIDEDIGEACLEYRRSKEDGMKKLKAINEAASAFDERVYVRLGELAARRYSEFSNERR